MPRPVKIDFVSDVACPWCAIGLAALERAMADIGNDLQVELRFQPPQRFRHGRQARFDIHVAHRRPGGARARRGRLRRFAVGANGGPGRDGFAADVAGLHAAASGVSSSRRRSSRNCRSTSGSAISVVSTSEAGAAA